MKVKTRVKTVIFTECFRAIFIKTYPGHFKAVLNYYTKCTNKMPEMSQDLFEVKNPVSSPLTPELLRTRANSVGKKGPAAFQDPRKTAVRIKRLSSCVSENDIESFTKGMNLVEHNWIDERELSHRFVNFA